MFKHKLVVFVQSFVFDHSCTVWDVAKLYVRLDMWLVSMIYSNRRGTMEVVRGDLNVVIRSKMFLSITGLFKDGRWVPEQIEKYCNMVNRLFTMISTF